MVLAVQADEIEITYANCPAVLHQLYLGNGAGMSLDQVARAAGCESASLKKWIYGNHRPSLFTLLCVLEVLGYCLQCDGQRITALTWPDWLYSLAEDKDAIISDDTRYKWRAGEDTAAKTIFTTLAKSGKKLIVVKKED